LDCAIGRREERKGGIKSQTLSPDTSFGTRHYNVLFGFIYSALCGKFLMMFVEPKEEEIHLFRVLKRHADWRHTLFIYTSGGKVRFSLLRKDLSPEGEGGTSAVIEE
jgi:hypothetical protein